MTAEEIEAVAYKDYLEIHGKVKSAFKKFSTRIKCSLPLFCSLHSIQETHTFQASSKNTWNVIFFYNCKTPDGCLDFSTFVYTNLPRKSGKDYLFMSGNDEFFVFILTSHFLKRYKERYLDPKQIKLNSVNPAIYFMRSNLDTAISLYTPNTWNEQEKMEKYIYISNQGLMAVKCVGKVLFFLTFLNQEHLTHYRSLVYDEEMLLREFINNAQEDREKYISFLRKIYRQQDETREKMYHFMRRCCKSEDDFKVQCKLFEDMMQCICKEVESDELENHNSGTYRKLINGGRG